jgi:hypothetical protein
LYHADVCSSISSLLGVPERRHLVEETESHVIIGLLLLLLLLLSGGGLSGTTSGGSTTSGGTGTTGGNGSQLGGTLSDQLFIELASANIEKKTIIRASEN